MSRRTVMKGAAWTVPALMVATAAPAYALSATGCQPIGTKFDAQARGRLLSGAIGGANLDAIVAVEGVHATAFGTVVQDTQANPLTVSALGAINLNLLGAGVFLSNILTAVADQNTGAINQFAHAHESVGTAGPTATAVEPEVGAAGAVNDASGVISLDESTPNPPQLATLDLYSLLEQATGNSAVASLVTLIADLDLEIGAVAGRAWLDSLCLTPEQEDLYRDYLLAYLRLVVASNVVGQLLTALTDPTEGLGTLTISTDAVWALLNSVPVLGPLLSALGQAALNVTVTVNTSLLTATAIPNTQAALQLDLGAGNLTVDVASLLGGPYPGAISPWLNSLSPNTRLFVDTPLPTNAVATLVDQWMDALVDRLKDLIEVKVQAGSVTGLGATGLLIEGSLRDFLEGTATAELKLLGAGISLGTALNPLLEDIGDLVTGALDTLLNDNALLQTALTALNGVLDALFTVLEGVLAITVNAQNDASGTTPSYYQAISPTGRYDVAALHLELLGFANLLNLSLARGSVGNNTPRP